MKVWLYRYQMHHIYGVYDSGKVFSAVADGNDT